MGLGQQFDITQGGLFSTWVRLSLSGYSQSEIEASLVGVPAAELARLKHRLRLNIIHNLRRVNLEESLKMSTTEQELISIMDTVRTEIRFAGMENDLHLRNMIKHQFGISVARL